MKYWFEVLIVVYVAVAAIIAVEPATAYAPDQEMAQKIEAQYWADICHDWT